MYFHVCPCYMYHCRYNSDILVQIKTQIAPPKCKVKVCIVAVCGTVVVYVNTAKWMYTYIHFVYTCTLYCHSSWTLTSLYTWYMYLHCTCSSYGLDVEHRELCDSKAGGRGLWHPSVVRMLLRDQGLFNGIVPCSLPLKLCAVHVFH